jgi:hypothetical protein
VAGRRSSGNGSLSGRRGARGRGDARGGGGQTGQWPEWPVHGGAPGGFRWSLAWPLMGEAELARGVGGALAVSWWLIGAVHFCSIRWWGVEDCVGGRLSAR